MKQDVLAWAEGRPGDKLVSKETLNHPGLIEMVTETDVYRNTPAAYLEAYEALGIDILNRVPNENAPAHLANGESRDHPEKPYRYTSLGLYDTAYRTEYACEKPEDVWSLDVAKLHYRDLITPVPHSSETFDIQTREKTTGETGLYYPMLYTTLFMWGVEVLGWEVFMTAAFGDPVRFHDHFLVPCAEISRKIVYEIAHASESPFVFVHDDLATSTGPVFPPSWYVDYIFPHYPYIWSAANPGKKVIFVADGNMTSFLPNLIQSGVDGIMFENPATPAEAVIEHFGIPGRYMIGGIDTVQLTMGSPSDVRRMVYDVNDRMRRYPGFAISSCGGLHGNIPPLNLAAYFDARADIGATPKNWRTVKKSGHQSQPDIS